MRERNPLYPAYKKWNQRILYKVAAWALLFTLAEIVWVYVFEFSVVSTLVFISLLAAIGIREWKRRPNQSDVISLVNRQLPTLEYSTELLVETQPNGLQALQQQKIRNAIIGELKGLDFPIAWKDFTLMAGTLIVMLGAGLAFTKNRTDFIPNEIQEKVFSEISTEKEDSIFIKSTNVYVHPPKYTDLSSKVSEEMNVRIPEGSQLIWNLDFQGEPQAVWIKVNNDSLPFNQYEKGYRISLFPKEDAIYTVQFLDKQGGINSTPFYQLQIIGDEPPVVTIQGIAQYQRLDYNPNLQVSFEVNIADDYGLTDGYLVATITKGSGESVKFREQKIQLKNPVSGKSHESRLTLRPDDFGMEPGNELYFYVTAQDNKKPMAQQSRTETYFFILRDSAEVEFSLQGSLGVDLMPDFFRSQLQIILDTEKLIKDKSNLKKEEFNSTSNELGYDQKQLRLKYGQFIGEEEDSGLEIETEEPAGSEAPSGENVLQEFGHDHDHENEEGQLLDKGTEHQHEHEESLDPEVEENPLEAFMHNHEDEETATFFTQTLKSKLKAALTQMWDAELYLRLFEPHKSLPYQYEAHRLLKEIKNHARIYVQRIGFDPPPVNESESRLTGKLKEINTRPFIDELQIEDEYTSMKKAIAWMSKVRVDQQMSDLDRNLLQAAGNELAALAIEQPGQYLMTLNELRNVLNSPLINADVLASIKEIQKTLSQAIPVEDSIPNAQDVSGDELNRKFLELLTDEFE